MTADGLDEAAASLPGSDPLAIEYLDARGADGMARKYRVMFIDGAVYPLHLAISADWKVHYFTAAMAAEPTFRAEEERFLCNMPAVLGERGMAALASIQAALRPRLWRHRFRVGGGRVAAAVRGQRDDGCQPARSRSDLELPPPRCRRRARGGTTDAGATRRGRAASMNDTAFADAMAHHQAGRFDAAAAAYRAILDRNPEHADSLHLLGLISVETDDPAAGIALIRRAMALEPGFAPHHNSLGHAFRRLGRLDDAARAYQDAAALRPGSAEIHNNLATTLCDLGRREEAIEHYRQAAEVAPDVADIWYNLANVLAETGASAEADVCYRTAIGLQPGLVHAHANYGRWLMTSGAVGGC